MPEWRTNSEPPRFPRTNLPVQARHPEKHYDEDLAALRPPREQQKSFIMPERYFRGDSACHENELTAWLSDPARSLERGSHPPNLEGL